MVVNDSLMSQVLMQHVVKHNKQKGHTFLPFILLYTGADALNLNELHPIQSRVKELICNLKNFRYVSFMPNRTGRQLHQGNSEAQDGGGGQGPLAPSAPVLLRQGRSELRPLWELSLEETPQALGSLCSVTHTEAVPDVQREPPALRFAPAASAPGTWRH